MTHDEDKLMLSRIARLDLQLVPDTLVEAYMLGREHADSMISKCLSSKNIPQPDCGEEEELTEEELKEAIDNISGINPYLRGKSSSKTATEISLQQQEKKKIPSCKKLSDEWDEAKRIESQLFKDLNKQPEKKEEWKKCFGYEDYYEVSSFGNVKRTAKRLRGKIIQENELMKPGLDSRGYLSVVLHGNPKDTKSKTYRRTHRIHELVTRTFLGEKPKRYDVNHKDGIKTNNHIDNLEYITRSENMLHFHRNKQPSQQNIEKLAEWMLAYGSRKAFENHDCDGNGHVAKKLLELCPNLAEKINNV